MSEINVTPFVDVMLVLLVIFMVTAPLLVTGVPVNLPETRAKGLDQDAKPTVVSIDRDGGLFIDDAQISGVKGQYTGRYGELAGSFTEVRANSVSGDVSVVHTVRGASGDSVDGEPAASGAAS